MAAGSAGRKRKFDEWDVSEIAESISANVHGVVTDVSPVKVSRKNASVRYFDGRITDGKKSVRVISFDPSLRGALETAREKGTAVSVVNCNIKAIGRGQDELEIMATNRSKVENSPRKFDVSAEIMANEPKEVQLSELPNLAVNQKVTVAIKVISVSAPETVKNRDGKELSKQDCTAGDASGCCRVVLWEKDVGTLNEDESYRILGVGVRSYDGSRFLSVGANCLIKNIANIGDVVEDDSADDQSAVVRRVVEGEIDGVVSCDQYSSCISCNSKVTNVNDLIGECNKCGMVMKIAKCRQASTAKVVVSTKDGKNHVLTMFDQVISNVIDGVSGENLSMKLLAAPPLKFNIDRRDVVYSVQTLLN